MNTLFEILLVEDNLGDILLTKEAFEEANFPNEVKVVNDGATAIEYLMKKNIYSNSPTPNLILLDINLPKLSGLEVLKLIKNDSHLKCIPVIILTTSTSKSDIAEAYHNHASCYITKETDFNIFVDMVIALKRFWIDKVVFSNFSTVSTFPINNISLNYK